MQNEPNRRLITNPAEPFRATLRAAGLECQAPIVPDGKLRRFKVPGDRERNAWYVLHSGPPSAGAFGCWKRNIKETWCEARGADYSTAEWQSLRRDWAAADNTRKQAECQRGEKARKLAAWIVARAAPATDHPYLAAKGISAPRGIKVYRGALVVPLRDPTGQIQSLQFIVSDGVKRFLTGGRIAGCWCILAEKPDGPIFICEGLATGVSLLEAGGGTVICAMSCENLKAAGEAARTKWPNREITFAADNDAYTEGNPGVSKATEAARAVNGKLAVPHFANPSTKPTDFNDLQRLEGVERVKTQMNATQAPPETDLETFDRLARLSPAAYDRLREEEAKRLNIRALTLDAEVRQLRPKCQDTLQGRAMRLAEVELWPVEVNGAEILDEVARTFSRYLALPAGAADVLALWTAHAYCFDVFQCSPRLNISSPEKGCGKTTLRDVLTVLLPRALPTENLSVAVLFRVIESHKPRLLADECDAWLRDNEELRGLLNAGHRRGGQALRCEGEGNEVRAFNVFTPAVLCGIGALPGTLHDRSIVIRLERAKPDETRERFDSRHTGPETELCRKLARFCADTREQFENCDPTLPPGAFNRLADNWRPLFAVATIAGGDWPARAALAFARATVPDGDAEGIGAMLLADIQLVFASSQAERMFTRTLLESLCGMTESFWPEAHRGKAINDLWLARRLRSFGITSRAIRIRDERAKGYEAADFSDAFARYLPPRVSQPMTP